VFWELYVFVLGGAISEPMVQGPDSDVAQNTLFGLLRHPVLPDTIKKYMSPALKSPGASYAPPAKEWL